jgi:hypothetical protein
VTSLLPLLLSLAVEDEPLGWRCSAERTIGDRTYRWERSIEGEHRFPPSFEVNRMSDPFTAGQSLAWNYLGITPADAAPTISFNVPLSRRSTRAVLRIVLPDGSERVFARGQRWPVAWTSSRGFGRFHSVDTGLNRILWAAGGFRALVEDRRGLELGRLEVSFPDQAEVARTRDELAREVDAMLAAPSRSPGRCFPYGEEAYLDPT